MAIGEYCSRDVHTIEVGASLREAARRMSEEGVGTLVAVQGEHPRGIVSDRDVAMRVLREGLDPDATPVGEVLGNEPIVVHASSPLRTVSTVMRRRAVRRLVVVDENEALVGVISSDDVLRLLGRELAGLAEVVEAQAPSGARRPTETADPGPEVE